MPRARVTATIPLFRMGDEKLVPDGTRILAQAEGLTGESMRFVLHSLSKQMDDSGIRLLAEGDKAFAVITITTEILDA